jgi:hypothetical protein
VVETTGGVSLTSSTSSSGSSSSSSSSSAQSALLVAYAQTSGGGTTQSGVNLSVASNGAVPTNTGGDSARGVNWGSWPGSLVTIGGNSATGTTHFIQASAVTSAAQLAAMPATLVSATYSYAGGPAPTNNTGAQGAINSLNVGVNFSSQSITSYAVNSTIAGATWNATGSGSVANFTGAAGILLNGNCAGCNAAPGLGPAATGSASGAFVGAAAEKMITTFGLKSAGKSMTGAAYLSR